MTAAIDTVRNASPAPFAVRLLAWFDLHGRHDLPWQQERTLYRVWVSEIMLQQTQVATVVPYFERFMARFVDLPALARADEDEVLHLWSGLGYYARARNLHRAAQTIVAHHGGVFPTDLQVIESLPGIGRSTAGAILAQALDARHPILDGNVKRVLTRWAGIEGYPGLSSVSERLWALADQLTPVERPCDYTQAIMDLGATCCRLREPNCAACPVSVDCAARLSGRIRDLPAPKPRSQRPVRETFWLILMDEQRAVVLLKRRSPTGLWGGLYGFIECESEVQVAGEWARRSSVSGGIPEPLPALRHAFTHFEMHIHPYVGRLHELIAAEDQDEAWYNLRQPPALGIAAPVAKLLKNLRVRGGGRAVKPRGG